MRLIKKWQNAHQSIPNRLPSRQILLAWIGAFLATLAFSGLTDLIKTPLILGSFGASCLLVFAYATSPFAQPRNVIGGHFVASLTGLVVMNLMGISPLSMAVAVATAIVLMLLLKVPHPPAGSNPLIVMLSLADWDFLVTPTLLGSVVLVAVALVYNNYGGKARSYPIYW
ncbi:HPP family protein [Moraxella osloensis]|uniref:HPP family protein n=1 Tax=Faucicola osloensis TaxID=34062 RepID=UPI002003463C|nr:HPP family protein [Moraxella osloensis]MCK6052687.1 HPP family protein [Moraxella osloensis]MCK6158979.1 HPP family protein [Moraxella osloensis]